MSDLLAAEALRAQLSRLLMPAGWKVAFNVAAVQQKLGITHALAAPLPSLHNYPSGARVEVGDERKLHVEAELALQLAADVRNAHDPLAVDGVAPCLELVDYSHPRGDIATMSAHSFFHHGIVLGHLRPLAQLPALPPGLPRAGTHARLPGLVPDDVLDALAGLSARVLEAGGMLRRGQLVLCGSYIDPIALAPGQRIEVDYGPELGTLSIAR
jgi:2-keto-4-pentenoate hydratase